MTPRPPTTARRSRLAVLRLGALAIILLLIGIGLVVIGPSELERLLSDVGSSRWGLIAFVAIYAIGVVLLIPGTMGTLTAGALFGFPVGAVAAVSGAWIGSVIAFLIARAMGREGAIQLLGPRLTRIDQWVGRNDFWSVFVLRLMPVVPFNALNYAAGLAAVRPSRYLVATFFGILPGTILTTAVADSADDPNGLRFVTLLGLFLLTLAASAIAARRYRPSTEQQGGQH